jgi:predicted metal-binding membrane protein
MSGHAHASGGSFLQAAVMWQVMMVAMMMPVAAPWLRAAFTLAGAHSTYARFHQSAVFAGGYVFVWTLYSVLAAGTQVALRSTHLLGDEGALPRPLAGTVLIAAGLFQLSPLKHACLRHCRNPLTYFITHWRSGSPSLFRMGLSHGMYCVACCWALMATAFALGVMNLVWMSILMLAVFAEQRLPWGTSIATSVGVGCIAWGLRVFWLN